MCSIPHTRTLIWLHSRIMSRKISTGVSRKLFPAARHDCVANILTFDCSLTPITLGTRWRVDPKRGTSSIWICHLLSGSPSDSRWSKHIFLVQSTSLWRMLQWRMAWKQRGVFTTSFTWWECGCQVLPLRTIIVSKPLGLSRFRWLRTSSKFLWSSSNSTKRFSCRQISSSSTRFRFSWRWVGKSALRQ